MAEDLVNIPGAAIVSANPVINATPSSGSSTSRSAAARNSARRAIDSEYKAAATLCVNERTACQKPCNTAYNTCHRAAASERDAARRAIQ